MKKLLLILLCLPMIGFGQLTYVPDDVFEEYIETNLPLADNGVNDNWVLTAGLDLVANYGIISIMGLTLNPTTLSSPIISDFTGIVDFVGLTEITISNLDMTTIDLSQEVFTTNTYNLSNGIYTNGSITIESCPLLTDIILPSDTICLTLNANTYLTNIVFQPLTFLGNELSNVEPSLLIMGCNSLSNIDISNILGVFNGSRLQIANNLNLTQLNLKNGFCYNWGTVFIGSSTNLFCVQVDDPNYSSISANWSWNEFDFLNQNNQYSYSTNCGWSTNIEEHTTNKELLKVTDLLGRETKKINQPLFYIYDDGTVEKRIVIE